MSGQRSAETLTSEVDLADVLGRSSAILIDFDGPVCAVFAGYPPLNVADEMRVAIAQHEPRLPPNLLTGPDPLLLLRWIGIHEPALVAAAEEALDRAELQAVETARPTSGADAALAAFDEAGREVAVVSNNSAKAIERYLEQRGLQGHVALVVGRRSGAPKLMKPDPTSLLTALGELDMAPEAAAFVGDSVTDIEAAERAGVFSIGFAKTPRRGTELAAAGADLLIDSMRDLVEALATE